jgi:LmbE family N-acetylglucosaminyl deacetylase
MAHAKLSPSASGRWLICPASVKEAASLPNTDSDASRKGTTAHEVLNIWLTTGEPPAVGTPMSNGLLVDDEMIRKARAAVEYIKGYVMGRQHTLMCEEEVEIGSAFGLEPGTCFGTADILAMTGPELLVADFKAGYNEVQAEENTQLLLYAIGACEEMGWMYEQIRLVILQPSSGAPKEWVITKADLLQRLDDLKPKVLLALTEDAPYHADDKACQYCPAAGICKELQQHSLALARAEFTNVEEHISRISVEDLAEILKKADLIEQAVAAARQHATKLIGLGQTVPGWKLVEGRKNRVWKDEDRAIAALRMLGFNEEEFAPRKMVTPAKAEGLLKNKEVMKDLIETPKGSPVLAPESDKRAALVGMTPVDFGNLLD